MMTTSLPSATGLNEINARRNSSMAVVVGLSLIVLALTAFLVGGLADRGTLAGLLVAPMCFCLVAPLGFWLVRQENQFSGLGSMLVLGAGLKLVAVLLRFEMVRTVYGAGDSNEYHRWADSAQAALRSFQWSALNVDAPIPGTGFIRLLTAGTYAIFGVDQFGGFLVFGAISFVASMVLYRAFTIGLPDGDRRLFALFVFCWPSWVFWPSSIGKEAWMVLSLSLAVLGAAHVFSTYRRGYLTLGIGIAAATLVRPHVAGLVVAAIAGALLVAVFGRRSMTGGSSQSIRVISLVVILIAGVLVSGRVMTLLGVDDLSAESVTASFDETVRLTSQGGSSFAATPVRTPLDIPMAVLTALVRPFPYEVPNLAAAIASLEGLLLLAAIAFRGRRFFQLPRVLLERPFAAAATLYILFFSAAFSAIGNFGILSRQRVQVYPFLFILLCLPSLSLANGRHRDDTETPSPSAAVDRRGTTRHDPRGVTQ